MPIFLASEDLCGGWVARVAADSRERENQAMSMPNANQLESKVSRRALAGDK